MLNEQGQRVLSLSGYREGMSTGPHLHYQLMGDLGGTEVNSPKWNMYADRRTRFLDAFGSTGSMYAGGDYMNYYYDINNLKERLAIR